VPCPIHEGSCPGECRGCGKFIDCDLATHSGYCAGCARRQEEDARKPTRSKGSVTTTARVHRTGWGQKKMTIVIDMPSHLKAGTRVPVRVEWLEPTSGDECICGLINARNCPVHQTEKP
jgi:hypothetical protein